LFLDFWHISFGIHEDFSWLLLCSLYFCCYTHYNGLMVTDPVFYCNIVN
jgi:hypothetical protein